MSRYPVRTMGDFVSFVQSLAEQASTSNRSLEEYLRALWVLIEKYKDAAVSFALLAQLLADALKEQPAPFDESWLIYESPPEELLESGRVRDSYGFLRKLILYQIADLHRMRLEGALDRSPRELWLGIERPCGHTWYNFTPATYLDCATGGFRADSENTECDWSDLAILLWLGQIYE